MRCREHSEDNECRIGMPDDECEGEDNCTHYQLNAAMLCPNCGHTGADWTGWAKHGGLNWTCWTCEETWVEPLIRPKTSGVCLRCGAGFDNPTPGVIHPEGRLETATSEWCAACNAFVMSIVFRAISAYRINKGELYDPMKGSNKHAST